MVKKGTKFEQKINFAILNRYDTIEAIIKRYLYHRDKTAEEKCKTELNTEKGRRNALKLPALYDAFIFFAIGLMTAFFTLIWEQNNITFT